MEINNVLIWGKNSNKPKEYKRIMLGGDYDNYIMTVISDNNKYNNQLN